jgi:hypothetical protein
MSDDRGTGSPLPPAPPASFGGQGCGKLALVGCAVLLLLVILAVAGGGVWFTRHGDEIQAGGKAGARDGARFGRVRDEAACFDEGRRRTAGSTTIQSAFSVGVFVRACLEYSRATPNFCRGVPPITALRRSAAWQGQTCGSDTGCRNVAQVVQGYCAEGRPKRTAADTLLMNASDSAAEPRPDSGRPAERVPSADSAEGSF